MTKSCKEYYLFHLLNDFSGSPMVLRQVAETVLKNGDNVTIVSSDGEGFLSNISGANYKNINYRWSPNKFLTLFNFFWTQFRLFIYVLGLPKSAGVYVNTLLPFGSACAAHLRGMEVIYHLHEPQVQPPILFRLLKKVAKQTSQRQIYVSNYLANVLSDIWIENRKTIYNAVPKKYENFIEKDTARQGKFTVLMACSQKRYKGIYEFLELAHAIPEVNFKLILNSKSELFNGFIAQNSIAENCEVLSAQNDMIPHYLSASLLLNLSHTDQWVESFGLTLIEAMCFGLPVIAPDEGGPIEIVKDNVSGYILNVKNFDQIVNKIKSLSLDENLYLRMRKNAKLIALTFGEERFQHEIFNFLKKR